MVDQLIELRLEWREGTEGKLVGQKKGAEREQDKNVGVFNREEKEKRRWRAEGVAERAD